MDEIKRYEAIYDGHYIANHKAEYTNGQYVIYEDHARVLAELRAALAKAEQDIEDRDRAIESLRLKVDTAHSHINALKARAERLAALVNAHDARFEARTQAAFEANDAAAKAARAAVDAHGDLEATP